MIKSRSMYGLFTREILLNMLSFVVILRSLNEILASFDIFALRCYNKTREETSVSLTTKHSSRKPRVKFAHKNSIYSQYFSLNP